MGHSRQFGRYLNDPASPQGADQPVREGATLDITSVRRAPLAADGGWRMADGGWRMADGGWRDEAWRWLAVGGGSPVLNTARIAT